MNAGFLHLFGRGVAKDAARAEELFKRGCATAGPDDQGPTCAQSELAPEECAIAGLELATGVCGAADAPRATSALAKGCKDGWSWACERAKGIAPRR